MLGSSRQQDKLTAVMDDFLLLLQSYFALKFEHLKRNGDIDICMLVDRSLKQRKLSNRKCIKVSKGTTSMFVYMWKKTRKLWTHWQCEKVHYELSAKQAGMQTRKAEKAKCWLRKMVKTFSQNSSDQTKLHVCVWVKHTHLLCIPQSVISLNRLISVFVVVVVVAGLRVTWKKTKVKSQMLPRLGAHTFCCIKMSVRTTYNRLVWFYMRFYLTLMHIAPVAIAIMLCVHVLPSPKLVKTWIVFFRHAWKWVRWRLFFSLYLNVRAPLVTNTH